MKTTKLKQVNQNIIACFLCFMGIILVSVSHKDITIISLGVLQVILGYFLIKLEE